MGFFLSLECVSYYYFLLLVETTYSRLVLTVVFCVFCNPSAISYLPIICIFLTQRHSNDAQNEYYDNVLCILIELLANIVDHRFFDVIDMSNISLVYFIE